MHSRVFCAFAVAGAASLATANPFPDLFGRAACNADNCLRAVRASSATLRGSTDCMSFMTTTYTPCAGTTTTTSPAPTTTLSASTTVTSTSTVQDTFHTYIFTTSTRTVTITTTPGFQKRSPPHTAAKRQQQQQQPSCTTGSLTSSSRIPSYASLCDSPARYASACSCNGVPASTRTLPPPSTSTVTLSPSSTATVTITGTSTYLTFEALATITDTYTRTLTETKTSTASPPTCTSRAFSQYYMCGCDGPVCMVQPTCAGTGLSGEQCAARCAANANCATYYRSDSGDCYVYYSCCAGGVVYDQDETC